MHDAALLRALELAAQTPELAGLLDSLPDLRLVRR